MSGDFIVSLIVYVLAVYGLTVMLVEAVDAYRSKKQAKPKLSVILKVLNQEEAIEGIVRKILKLKWQVGDFNLMVIDDGSLDNTLAILKRLQTKYAFQIIAINKEKNQQKEILAELLKEPISPLVCYIDLGQELDLINRPEKISKILKGIA